MGLSFAGRTIDSLVVGHEVDVDVHTGRAVLRVPVPAPPGRGGMGPGFSLSYSSGAGNSPYGAGWNLEGLPTIGIRTDAHLPRWDGTDGFHFAGDELVPWLEEVGSTWRARGFEQGEWSVAFLRIRRGDSRVRIEKWLHVPTSRIHFRVRDANGVMTVFGARPDASGRIRDPDDPARTFAWLPEFQVDEHGNAVWIEYASETLDGVDRAAPNEQRRPSLAQRYPKRVLYGNAVPIALSDDVLEGARPGTRWSFQVVFDYGDHTDGDRPRAEPDRAWPVRADPYSSCRPGFEVRTYRLCRRILSFHDFPELGAAPTLVGVLSLRHDEHPVGSTVAEIGYAGCRIDDGTPSARALPPLRLTYAPPASATAFESVALDAQENVPGGLGAARYVLVDLHGNGLPGILLEADRAWYYKPNLGDGHFGPQALVEERPAVLPGSHGFTDFDRDGSPETSRLLGRLAGRFDLDREERHWRGYRPYAALPHAEALAASAQWADLNGDGLPDLVVAKDGAIAWYASDREGFAAPVEIPLPHGTEAVPTVSVDASLNLFVADMNGDGLPDVVRVQNGRIEYWPSLGNGRFGERVQLEGAPEFAPDDEFDPARLRFADLDGSGTADVVYLGRGEVVTWINGAGNCVVPGPVLHGLPYIDNVSTARILDLRADGRTSLVWSSPLPGLDSPTAVLALTPRDRPRLLLSVDDSRGRETRITYSSSSAHYFRDQRSGRGWSTSLPFHRPVADRLDVIDQIRGTRSVRRFDYHDGFFDGNERELRGFGLVDEYDGPEPGDPVFAPDVPEAVPSVVRTWFHLGTPMWHRHRLAGIYAADGDLPHLLPHVVDEPDRLGPGELEDGLCTLAGTLLRRETYAVDAEGSPGPHPIEVYQATPRLRCVQPALGAARAAFDAVPREELTATYEASAGDPRLVHHVVLDADRFGFVTRDATIAYPRREGMPRDVAAQGHQEVVVKSDGVQHIDETSRFRLAVPIESRTWSLVGLRPAPSTVFAAERFLAPEVSAALAAPDLGDHELVDDPGAGPRARLMSAERAYYWNDARTDALPLGQVGEKPVAHHEETACFSPATVASILGDRIDASRLVALGYESRDGLWWRADPTLLYTDAPAFTLPRGVQRADGSVSAVEYDAHAVEVVGEVDAVGNRTTAEIDYHVLAPWRLVDANGYTREVRYDALGVLVAESHQGLVDGEPWGFDALAHVVQVVPSTLADAVADPEPLLRGAYRAVWYDLDAWRRDGLPTAHATFTREELRHDGAGGGALHGRVAVAVHHADGLGRPLQVKRLVEPGPAIQRDGAQAVVTDGEGRPVLADTVTRWHSSGHVVFDRRERAVGTHQPFFSGTFDYEDDDVLRRLGVSTTCRCDALGRVVRHDFPNGTFDATTFGAWAVEQSDPNDTVLESSYKAARESLPVADPERQALDHASAHAGTSRLVLFDPAGRQAGILVRGGASADRRAETRYDPLGNVREVIDPRGLLAFAYRRDMNGRLLYERSADAGESRTLPDAANRLACAWTARGFEVVREYDQLDRPLHTHVRGGDGPVPLDHRVEERVYGEAVANAVAKNLRGRLVVLRDADGEATLDRSDPAGRPLTTSRRLRVDVSAEPDWRQAIPLESQTFLQTADYDALGRPVREELPDGTTRRTEYLPGGGRSRVAVTTPGGQLTDVAVLSAAEYDERGQRVRASFGNGLEIEHEYDQVTFRPTIARARRGSRVLQQCRYTHDPVGNLVRLVDEAQASSTAIVSNVVVDARRDFVYDAHYRLRHATGRVHRALLQHDYAPGAPGTRKGTRHLSLNDGGALERYTRQYDYDPSGNLQRVRHNGASQSWTTEMWISPVSNRSVPAENPNGTPVLDPEAHFDPAGHLRVLSHLRRIDWSWRGTLERAVTIERPGGVDDDERYVYGAAGLRTRRIQTRVVTGTETETIETLYLGDVERRRIRRGANVVLERWNVHVSDGHRRIATLARWTRDDLAREVDDVTRPRVTYEASTDPVSCSLRIDEQGDVVSYEEYFPYGATAFAAGDRLREADWSDYRYSGKERDDATGLYCYGYRYYAPWMGRWLSPDPMGPQDDLNLYQFVRGDPIGRVDPTGLDSVPGKVKYTYIDPPKPATDVESKITNWRAALPKSSRRGFDSLSHDDQVKFVTAPFGSVHLVPADPDSPAGASGWAVISKDRFESWWLPARIAWAKKEGVQLRIVIPTENPARLSVIGGSGGAAPATAPQAPSGAQAGGGGGSSQTGGATGASGDGGPQGGAQGGSQGAEGGGAGAGRGQGPSGRAGAGASGGAGKGGNGSGGGIRGLEGSGVDSSDVYGGIGGLAGGQSWGVVGGTPFSVGNTPGGHGASPDETGAGNGHGAARGSPGGPGSGGGGGVTAGGGGTSARDGTGAGGNRAGAAPSGGGRPPAAESANAKGQAGRGKAGGTATHEKTGWDVVVEMAGVTNLAFDGDSEHGRRHGIPGGLGLLGLEGRFLQGVYVVLSVINLVLTLTGITELLAALVGLIKGLFRLGLKLITRLPALLRLGLRAIRNLLSKLPALTSAARGLGSRLSVALSRILQSGGQILRRQYSVRGWLRFRSDLGGETVLRRLTGWWPRYSAVVRNFDLPGTFGWLDTAAHEAFHALIARRAGIITWLGDLRLLRVPIGAPVKYVEEVFAYAIGRLAAGRLHVFYLAPIEAFGSLSRGETIVTALAMGFGYLGATTGDNEDGESRP